MPIIPHDGMLLNEGGDDANATTAARVHRLSGMLQSLGMTHYRELPPGTVSLRFKLGGEKLVVEAYDATGKIIGKVPSEKTSSAFATNNLQRAFGKETFTDDAIIAIVSNPMKVSG